MASKAIITSCSNKFFPSVINLLTSIKVNYPDHPTVYVYDLGLLGIFRQELELIENVKVITMPAFCPHWRACYTWKTYIFAHPLADLNFYLDAGSQVLRSLEAEFMYIEEHTTLLIDVSCKVKDLIPSDYRQLFDLKTEYNEDTTFSAGIIGFKKDPTIQELFDLSYLAACAGLALGFSRNNLWRNKGKDKSIFVRDCDFFRHDQTVINLFFKRYFGKQIKLESHDNFSVKKNKIPNQAIWHLRTQWTRLDFLKIGDLHKKSNLVYLINRLYIAYFIIIKNIIISLKKVAGVVE